MKLQGKVALVTGGAIRVGKAVALALAREGADIAFSFNSSARPAEETAQEIKALGRRAFFRQADVAEVMQCQALVADTVRELGRLDVLVNSASLWCKTPLGEITEADWDKVTSIVLKGAIFTSQAAAPHLAGGGAGAIINIVDLSAWIPFPRYIAHSVAKAGLLNLTYSLAMNLAPHVRVNAIAPGLVLPPPEYTEQQIAAAAKRTLLERWGSAEDVAEAVVYLATARYVTGAVLHVDGGEHLK